MEDLKQETPATESKADLRKFNKAEEQVTKAMTALTAIVTIKNADELVTVMDVLSKASKVDKIIEAKRVEIVKPWNDSVKKVNQYAKDLAGKLPPAIQRVKTLVIDFNKNQQKLLEKTRLEMRGPKLEELGFKIDSDGIYYNYEHMTITVRDLVALDDNQWFSVYNNNVIAVAEFRKSQLEKLNSSQELNNVFGSDEDIKETAEKIEAVQQPVISSPGAFAGSGSTTQVKGITKRWTYSVIDETQIPREFLVIDSAKIRKAIAEGNRSIAGLTIFQEDGLTVR